MNKAMLFRTRSVALLAEGVDRNADYLENETRSSNVALLAEGVDRNPTTTWSRTGSTAVALLAEGVDRNCEIQFENGRLSMSPSSRRAWIEIPW